jgi:succinate dehydrogenase / fumarate reductase, cytochrome b subunit
MEPVFYLDIISRRSSSFVQNRGFMSTDSIRLPRAFIWRRVHSLTGLWVVLFLMEHLLVNSQAALWLGENGKGFVNMVNGIHNLPYLQVIEIFLLGVPLALHLFWGIKYLFTSRANSYSSDGSKPSLPEYGRNRAYTWQRITSWILVVGLIGHVAKFRFLDYPITVHVGGSSSYFVSVSKDRGLPDIARRLGVTLFDQKAVEREIKRLKTTRDQEEISWIEGLRKRPLSREEVIVEAHDFGTASLFSVRDTFKSPIYVALYTLFVLAACFHAFNGFWTFLISWGIVLRMSAQKSSVKLAITLMTLVAFLGLISVWGTYWLNLKGT